MSQEVRAIAVTRHVAGALALALVVCVLVLGSGVSAGRADAMDRADVHPEWGSTSAEDGVLRRGCRNYAFSYSLTPPDQGTWALETFIVGPKGKRLASDAFLEGFDDVQGSATFRLCKPTTRPGLFKIRAKFSNQDGDDLVEGMLPQSTFRLRVPG